MAKQRVKQRKSNATISQVVSGGQTGVDRAALDAAIDAGIPTGGWCPRGRRSEDGRVPDDYPLRETAARSYAVRTEWNVRDSDGTLIIVRNDVSSGTRLTIGIARKLVKPLLVIHVAPPDEQSLLQDENSLPDQILTVVDWVRDNRIRVLNVAGPRASSDDNMYPAAFDFLRQLFGDLKPKQK